MFMGAWGWWLPTNTEGKGEGHTISSMKIQARSRAMLTGPVFSAGWLGGLTRPGFLVPAAGAPFPVRNRFFQSACPCPPQVFGWRYPFQVGGMVAVFLAVLVVNDGAGFFTSREERRGHQKVNFVLAA